MRPLFNLLIVSSALLMSGLKSQELSCEQCFCYYDNKSDFVVDCTRSIKLKQFEKVPAKVNELDVSNTRIRNLGRIKSGSLKKLTAKHNGIDEVSVENLPNLLILDVKFNNISRLDKNKLQASIERFDLSYNQLTKLPESIFSDMLALKYLDLSHNPLAMDNLLHTGISGNVTHLMLNGVFKIDEFPADFFTDYNLLHLGLADNYMTIIPKLPQSLRYLDLSGNNFFMLDVHQLNYPYMKTLKLNRLMGLALIEKYAFYNMQYLEVLELEHCSRLKELDDLAFGVLTDLEKWTLRRFSIAGSGIRRLNDTYFTLFNEVDEIDIGNNPWHCDCNVVWFALIKRKLVNPGNIRCVTPAKLRNRAILNLSAKDLPKCVLESAWRMHRIMVSVISILVVLLVGIVIYLIYLGPFLRKGNGNPVGTFSPYNHNLIINNDS